MNFWVMRVESFFGVSFGVSTWIHFRFRKSFDKCLIFSQTSPNGINIWLSKLVQKEVKTRLFYNVPITKIGKFILCFNSFGFQLSFTFSLVGNGREFKFHSLSCSKSLIVFLLIWIWRNFLVTKVESSFGVSFGVSTRFLLRFHKIFDEC
jgi:hypothetical protein